jgi:hypothetical protein
MKSGTSTTSRLAGSWRRLFILRWPRGAAIVFCGVVGTLLPAAYGTHAGVREPVVHDEFSYLLAADTFAHWRLSNPSPQHPEFFEAPHILVVPSYCSKYPPGQGLMLAMGQVLCGRPIWGVWLSCGLFAAALCWMLQAWTSGPWALATTALAIATCGFSSYWAQSYWGGMVAACGGALLFGSMRRTLRAPHAGSSILMGAGVVTLANTRPFEGLLACVAAGVPLTVWLVQNRGVTFSAKLARWLFPVSGVVLIGVAWMAYYNLAVTGSWLTPPYVVHQNQYFDQGVFRFSSPRPPDRKPVPRVAAFYAEYKKRPQRGLPLVLGTLESFYRNLAMSIDSSLGMTLETRGLPFARLWLLALIATVSLQDRWVWFCLGTVCLVLMGAALVWWWFPHYVAPIYSIEIAVLAMTLRRADARTRRLRPARRMAPLIVAIMAALFIALPMLNHVLLARYAPPEIDKPTAASARDASPSDTRTRPQIIRQLERQAGRHLVFVRYDPDFTVHEEWVYNGADLAGSSVIFAHDLGPTKNAQLTADFPGRALWIVHVNSRESRLEHYR